MSRVIHFSVHDDRTVMHKFENSIKKKWKYIFEFSVNSFDKDSLTSA